MLPQVHASWQFEQLGSRCNMRVEPWQKAADIEHGRPQADLNRSWEGWHGHRSCSVGWRLHGACGFREAAWALCLAANSGMPR